MRVGITPNSSDDREVVDVEKTNGKVTGERCWRITLKLSGGDVGHSALFGGCTTVLRFRDQRVEVK